MKLNFYDVYTYLQQHVLHLTFVTSFSSLPTSEINVKEIFSLSSYFFPRSSLYSRYHTYEIVMMLANWVYQQRHSVSKKNGSKWNYWNVISSCFGCCNILNHRHDGKIIKFRGKFRLLSLSPPLSSADNGIYKQKLFLSNCW